MSWQKMQGAHEEDQQELFLSATTILSPRFGPVTTLHVSRFTHDALSNQHTLYRPCVKALQKDFMWVKASWTSR